MCLSLFFKRRPPDEGDTFPRQASDKSVKMQKSDRLSQACPV